ncbi:MAG TPA: hypothetical protein VMX17_05900 [Candidatus Glassbacteria bacterium]|nr:hypothetical protein [Candidatus Glassbacteria bacterium]
MNTEIERLAKIIARQEKSLETFDQKKEGSSARQDLLMEIIRLKERLANAVLVHVKQSNF